MKFEGNIPSYLRTGAGAFAVSDKKLANVEKTENLFGYPIEVPLLRVPHEGFINSELRNKAKTLMMDRLFFAA